MLVLEDVMDDCVSLDRAVKDYGVVIRTIDAELCAYEVDEGATRAERDAIRRDRSGWLAKDPEAVAVAYRAGEIDRLDVVRRYAVILDWDTGALLPISTGQFRAMFHQRSAQKWGPKNDGSRSPVAL